MNADKDIDSFEFQNAIKKILKNEGIKNEVCGRINSVFVYNTLGSEVVLRIAIEEIRKMGNLYGLEINDISHELLRQIASLVANSNEGARPIVNIVADKLENSFSGFAKTRKEKQDNTPTLPCIVDVDDRLEVISTKTDYIMKINEILDQCKDIVKTKKTTAFNKEQLKNALKAVKGQEDNVDLIVETVNTWLRKAKKNKPLVFMLAGTSGTGKTFTAETISTAIKDFRMVKLNMNEYHNDGDVWKLLGSSSGYIGSDKESPIFAARRESDKLVILFDEIEKAHESLFTTIMTLMEKGEMANGHGESFDFKQSLIFFTTNLAMGELLKIKREAVNRNLGISTQEFQDKAKSKLKAANLKSEICGRIDWLLIYNTLGPLDVAQIAMEKIRSLGIEYEININRVPNSFLEDIAMQCKDNNEGARPINRMVTNRLESILQDAYESELFNSAVLYDIDEMFHIVPSANELLLSVEEIIQELKLT